MVLTIDTTNKTITIESPTKIEDILSFIEKFDEYKEYSIVSKIQQWCYPQYDWNQPIKPYDGTPIVMY